MRGGQDRGACWAVGMKTISPDAGNAPQAIPFGSASTKSVAADPCAPLHSLDTLGASWSRAVHHAALGTNEREPASAWCLGHALWDLRRPFTERHAGIVDPIAAGSRASGNWIVFGPPAAFGSP